MLHSFQCLSTSSFSFLNPFVLQVIFALNQTLQLQRDVRQGKTTPQFTTEDLIKYNYSERGLGWPVFSQELQMWKSQLNCFQPRYNTGDKNDIKFDFYSFQWPSIDIDKWIYINRYFPLLPGSTFDGTQPSWHGRGKDRQRDWRLLQVLSCVSLASGLKIVMQGPADIQEEQEDGRQSDWAALEQSGSDFFPLILRLKIWNASWSQITQASPFSLLLARAILSGSRLSLTLSGKLASK